jgi:hypothetical protein
MYSADMTAPPPLVQEDRAYALGQRVFLHGPSCIFRDGYRLTHGQMGVMCGGPANRSFIVTVCFGKWSDVHDPFEWARHLHERDTCTIDIPDYLVGTEPPPPLPGGFVLGDKVVYAGTNPKIPCGSEGEVMGPGVIQPPSNHAMLTEQQLAQLNVYKPNTATISVMFDNLLRDNFECALSDGKDNNFTCALKDLSKVGVFEFPSGDEPVCAFCGAKAVLRCATCQTACYCRRKCQKLDWSRGGHKEACARAVAKPEPDPWQWADDNDERKPAAKPRKKKGPRGKFSTGPGFASGGPT